MSADIAALCARARQRDSDAIEALAWLVEVRLEAPRPRGSDQQATERAHRDAALRRLARMVGAAMPAERLAPTWPAAWNCRFPTVRLGGLGNSGNDNEQRKELLIGVCNA